MNLNNIDLNKIRIFHSVVACGSYALAAQEVGLTRSAISQSMTTLEGQIGAPLFLRKGRRLFPTKEAMELSRSFEGWQKSLAQVLGRVTGSENSGDGLVRIGSYYEFARTNLAKKIKEFSTDFPRSRFRMSFDSPSRLQQLLVAGQLDMCFSIFPHEGSQDIESLPIFKQELVLVAPKAWKILCDRAEDITEWPVVEYYKNHQLLPRWLKCHFGKKNYRLDPQIFAASAEMLLELVKLEMGIGVVPKYLITELDLKTVQILEPPTKPLTDFIWLNQYVGQFENSAHREFYHFIK